MLLGPKKKLQTNYTYGVKRVIQSTDKEYIVHLAQTQRKKKARQEHVERMFLEFGASWCAQPFVCNYM